VTVDDPVERRIEGAVQVQVDPLRDLDFAAALKFLLRQDPEVLLVGEIRDAETARVAVRAAMTGHLVLSSLHCGRAAEARPRLVEMGVEPWAVDLALDGVVAQRLVRLVCTACAGHGCADCLSTGYRFRTALAEVLRPGRDAPFRPLDAHARALVASGATSGEEVRRVLGGDA
jgi:general secretion pathway protein E